MATTGEVAANPPREQWSGQTGFILAAIGSAVGLGNIWRFPGVAYENGGGAFLIPYIVALITAGIPILFLDYSIGHRFRGSAPLSLRRIGGRPLEALGWFQVAIAFVISLYYTAVIAWALSYFVFSFDLRWGDDPGGFFQGEYLQVSDPGISFQFVPGVLIPLVLVWIATLAVLGAGVAKGLERANVIFLPLLVGAFLVLVIRALFLDGAGAGLTEFFTPDFAALANPGVWIAAYGQIFFSLSIAFGIMITYASYRRRRANLTTPGLVVAFANSSFEILAGIGVFATLGFFAFQQGITVGELEGLTGVGLSFVTFPAIVSQMPGGPLFGALFFGSLTLAGFTSLLSVLQVVSAGVQEKFRLSRIKATLGIGGAAAVLSVLLFSTTTGLIALDVVDNWSNNVGIVASAVLTTILVIWVLRKGPELQHHLNAVSTFQVGRVWIALVGVLVPVLLGYMLISRILQLVLEGYGGYPGLYLGIFGWGTIGLIIAAAVVCTVVPWRSHTTSIAAWPPFPPESGRTASQDTGRS